MTRRRVVLAAAAALLLWAIAILVAGGVVIDTRWGPITSRAAIRPFIGGVILLLFYVTRWREHWAADLGRLHDIPPASAVVTAALLVTVTAGLLWSTRIAGGPDASGYVSEADLFAHGKLTIPTPSWVADAPWNAPAIAAAPVGYTRTTRPDRLAPVYSPGLPLLMALFQIVGGPVGVFYVTPLLGALTIWVTWRLGRDMAGAWAGAAGAVLVTTSAPFLAMLVQPMSDVAAAAFWTLAVYFAGRDRPIVSGATTAFAILVRPNIAPVAAIPLLLFGLRPWRSVLFCALVAPAAAVIGALNWYYYGSPLHSGYGSLSDLYDAGRIGVNLRRYGGWFVDAHTAFPLAGLLAPFAIRDDAARWRVTLVTTVLPLALLAMYLPYLVFYPHEWLYLRFLLPAYPALMIGCAIAVQGACWWIRTPVTRTVAAIVVVAALSVYSWEFARARGVFAFKVADERYARAVAKVQSLPARSVIVSLAHSGTLHFYTGRDVLRFEALDPTEIDPAIFHLQDQGYAVYLVGDDFEIELFRRRTAGTRTGALFDAAKAEDLGGCFFYTLIAPEPPRAPRSARPTNTLLPGPAAAAAPAAQPAA